MHNVDTDALNATIAAARANPAAAVNPVTLDGDWNPGTGPQFATTITYPGGETTFAADFPAHMGGSGAAPNPLAYCFWGGLACYAMTFAQEAAQAGIEIRAMRGRVAATVDMTRALGVSDNPPVEGISWHLDVDSDAGEEQIAELKALADERCPGAYCVRNPVALETHVG